MRVLVLCNSLVRLVVVRIFVWVVRVLVVLLELFR